MADIKSIGQKLYPIWRAGSKGWLPTNSAPSYLFGCLRSIWVQSRMTLSTESANIAGMKSIRQNLYPVSRVSSKGWLPTNSLVLLSLLQFRLGPVQDDIYALGKGYNYVLHLISRDFARLASETFSLVHATFFYALNDPMSLGLKPVVTVSRSSTRKIFRDASCKWVLPFPPMQTHRGFFFKWILNIVTYASLGFSFHCCCFSFLSFLFSFMLFSSSRKQIESVRMMVCNLAVTSQLLCPSWTCFCSPWELQIILHWTGMKLTGFFSRAEPCRAFSPHFA